MIYKAFQDLHLSALGMGCMRLPTAADGTIDMTAARQMVAYAMEHGINYYDTAWGYHNGCSEPAMGEILSEYPRESYYLASKFPGYDQSNMDKVESIFEQQLQRCRTDYFDFYLFHNVCELNIDAYLNEKYGIHAYLMEQKKNGRIRHLGFSIHGTLEILQRFLDAYGRDIEFCQVQLNWLDWEFQNAKAKVEMLRQWGIPVWVMEPVRGGTLCRLEEKHEARLRALCPERTVPQWAFRFLQGFPDVTVTLSGMSNMHQLQDNIATYAESKPLTQEEADTLVDIAAEMTAVDTVPCTGCRYCVTHCPKGLDIPWLIELYNEQVYSGGGFRVPMALQSVTADKRPGACIGCGACEAVCPQKIHISAMMEDFADRLG